MAEIKLTAAQQAVVDDRGGALLVSAAAGSGKTKVLVDRLLARVCDLQKPCNVDDFLVITYTKAAAAELRVKISQALSARIAEDPSNRHLQRQMHRIYLAEISTVHAFCSDLLRTYAHLLDIPADFRVAEETESNVLKDRVLGTLLEEGYSSESVEFREMVEAFGYGRDDRRLPEAVKLAHNELRCRADMDGWLASMLEALDISRYEDALETPWGAYLFEEFQTFLQRQIEKMESALQEMSRYPNIQKGLDLCFRENIQQMRNLLCCKTWDEIVRNKVESFGRAGTIRKPEDPFVKERLANIRTLCWKDLQKWQKQFFADSKSVLQDLKLVTPGAQSLLRFAKQFDLAYAEEKKKRKLLDFSDLEHYAIRLLTDKYTHQPSRTAKEISARFEEIMVDEYQDSNEVQETIFEAISKNGKNRFMVGDVKQSIYRFRLADPTLFLRKYLSYQNRDEAPDGAPRKILLSENFRSRNEILSACNDVFRLIMRKNVGDLEYTDAEALKLGRTFPALPDSAVELHCLTHSNPAQPKAAMEADYVAARIRRMLDEKTEVTDGDTLRPVQPGDIAILMRSLSSTAGDYLAALGRYGIPAVCERGGSLLDTSEVQILIAILQVIDNPHQDVPLLTALASPVFGFSSDQLAVPRMSNRKDDYYDTICDRSEFRDVIQILHDLQENAKWMNLHELIDDVFSRTGMVSVFASMPDGLRRERNLMAFRSFTVSFEAAGSRSLPQLLWYLKDLQDAGGSLPVPKGAVENAVTIMTVHSSKGLEFPVVFLCDLSRTFNLRDMQDAILVDDDLAVGCNRVDNQRFVRYTTLAKNAIVHKQTREAISEELRILYVAMTRAQDRLIMTYYSRYLITELKNIILHLTIPLSDDLCMTANNPGKWILMAALCRTEAGQLFAQCGSNEAARVWDTVWDIQFHDLLLFAPQDEHAEYMADALQICADKESVELLKYEYPYQEICNIPGKITATQLKGRMQDQEIADGAGDLQNKSAFRFRRPQFLKRDLSPAEKGTATHLFMQFASYSACKSESEIKKELQRLCAAYYITEQQAQAVEISKILRFFNSELGCWLLAQEPKREFKFSLMVDTSEYGLKAEGERVMLQGVIDCFVVEEDGLTIIDFKTDQSPHPEYYAPQLDAYGKALSRIYQMPVKQKILYFFSTGEAFIL